MKLKYTLALLLFASMQLAAQTQSFYDFSWPTLAGDTISMSRYAGKKVMVVNVASYCAYTPEFAPLSQLDSIYAARYNFAIIGFPCNDFGHQEGTDSALTAVCHGYNVNFQIMSAVHISPGDTSPIYKWLQRSYLNGVANHRVSWNFNKFLIDRQGNWVNWYDSPTSPLDNAITSWIVADSASVNTGIETTEADQNSFSIISDNPATENILLQIHTASAQKLDINIYTIDGRLAGNIYTGNTPTNGTLNYSVSAMPSGVYFVRATSATMDKTIKCVIRH